MELDFDKLFKFSMTALKVIGWDPRLNRNKPWLLRITFLYGSVASYFILMLYNIIYYDLKNNNFTQTSKNGTHAILFITATFNTYVMIFHQNSLMKLIENVIKDYKSSNGLTIDEQLVVKKYANQGTYICQQWFVIAGFGAVSLFLKNIFLYVYYYWINEFKLVPFYDVFYPKIIEENKDNLFVYLLLYFYVVLNVLYITVMMTGFVPVGPIMMLHACGQLEIVKKRIDNLFENPDDDVILKKLKTITEQLQYIYSFVESTGDTFRIAYEWTLKGSSLIVPVSLYAIVETAKHGEFSVEFIIFVVGGLFFSSSPCYYSDLLMEKGEEVRMSLYTCGWERHYTRRARTSLPILLLYALRPVAIKSVFNTLCLDTLTNVYRQCYTIFNLMNAVWE